jgi:hypothetical protein
MITVQSNVGTTGVDIAATRESGFGTPVRESIVGTPTPGVVPSHKSIVVPSSRNIIVVTFTDLRLSRLS